MVSQLHRSYLADLRVARVGSFAAGSKSLTRSSCSVSRGESGMTEYMAASGPVSSLLCRFELSFGCHIADSLCNSESGSWLWVPSG